MRKSFFMTPMASISMTTVSAFDQVKVPPARVAQLPLAAALSILILPDLHIPSAGQRQKQLLLDNRQFLDHHDWVVLLGDVTNCYGTPLEYRHVDRFIEALGRPYSVVNGNHEFTFSPMIDGDSDFGKKWEHGTPEEQRAQLERFNHFYGIDSCYQSARHPLAGFTLLGLDAIGPDDSAVMSDEHQNWFEQSLVEMRELPLLVFSHFPFQDSRLDNIRYYVPGRRPYYIPSQAVPPRVGKSHATDFLAPGHVHFRPTHPLATPYKT